MTCAVSIKLQSRETNRPRMYRKLLNATTKNVPGTATLEQASTMAKLCIYHVIDALGKFESTPAASVVPGYCLKLLLCFFCALQISSMHP